MIAAKNYTNLHVVLAGWGFRERFCKVLKTFSNLFTAICVEKMQKIEFDTKIAILVKTFGGGLKYS